MSLDFRPLVNTLNSWLQSPEGQELFASIPEGTERELFSYREGGFRRNIVLRSDGLFEDYYPATQPKLKGERIERLFDAHHVVEGAWESGEYKSLQELEADIFKRFGVTNKPGSA